jgi:transcriptional regulator with XRE-family HTH domain
MDGRTLLGRRVKHLRRLRKLTQEQLAEHIEINPKYLSSIEEGTPPAQLCRKVERLLAEVTVDDLPRMVRMLEALIH